MFLGNSITWCVIKYMISLRMSFHSNIWQLKRNLHIHSCVGIISCALCGSISCNKKLMTNKLRQAGLDNRTYIRERKILWEISMEKDSPPRNRGNLMNETVK